MEPNKRIGLLIIITSAVLATIFLILSDGWGDPNYPLTLFGGRNYLGEMIYFRFIRDPDWAWLKPFLDFLSQTRNILALLIVSAAYGLCLNLSLLPLPRVLIGASNRKETEGSSPTQQHDERNKDNV